MPTPLQITASTQFKQFTDFALGEIMSGNSKAIARQGDASTMPGVLKITTTTDDKAFAIRRSQDNKNANDATRAMFKKAIADMFGGESRIPESVLNAMNMKDFGSGKPLTARRIIAVKRAVDMEQTKLRQANQWLTNALRHSPAQLSDDQKQQATRIIAKYGNSLWKAGANIRGRIIDKLIDIVADPKLGPHADDLFALIPWKLEKLSIFTLDDVREQAPQKLFAGD